MMGSRQWTCINAKGGEDWGDAIKEFEASEWIRLIYFAFVGTQ
jgi:hypothetical protein